MKNLPGSAGDAGPIPGLGSSPGGGHGNPLWYSCLENLDGGAWRGYSAQGRKESDRAQKMQAALSNAPQRLLWRRKILKLYCLHEASG